jgi:trehalose 6-phosphate synthase/phosphatase
MRLLIISNRLPVTVEQNGDEINIKESSGGLVSGLSSYLDSLKGSEFPSKSDYIWIGWPGIEIDKKNEEKLKQKIYSDYRAYPVYFPEKTMEKFYQGFCNNTIWPLFHYFPSLTSYEEEEWGYYKHVNEKFCDAVMEMIKPDDVVWIHDYHLMLLPELLRKRMPDIKIGFFLHIPFPTFEIYGLLPGRWRTSILKGLLGADIIGFHTYDYTQYFLRCVLRVLGMENNMGKLLVDNRICSVDTFPMGIDFQKFRNAVDDNDVKANIAELKNTLNYERVLLSIDRLDYTKGILNRLKAYELFLEQNPDYYGRIILLLFVIPSRIGVKHYKSMKKQIDEAVGRINGKFGKIEWSPISYQYDFIPFKQLVAIYSLADIIMVTPLRDGMNLISKEYLACRKDKTGVLILSEMAGSSKELGEAIIVNPNHLEEIASAIKEAIEMPQPEQAGRISIMQERLSRYDVTKWADDFIQKLVAPSNIEHEWLKSKLLNEKQAEQIIAEYKKARKSLIFLDYDGTLVPFTQIPQMAKPDNSIISLLTNLANSSKNDLVLISGRDRYTLHEWLSGINLSIIAEHGAWVKEAGQEWKQLKQLSREWKKELYPIFETYIDRLPDSFIEEKEFSLVLHYRKSDPELASVRTKEFIDLLLSFTANSELQILQGNKIIEVRNAGVNKGIAGLNWVDRNEHDFILAIGDDWTDEDLFKVLPESAYSIKVGLTHSFSKYFLPNSGNVIELLEKLAKF